jgi:hypothetical protein
MSVWVKNLLNSLATRPVVILHGNVRDRYIQDNHLVYDNLTGLLSNAAHRLSQECGLSFAERIFYDPIGQERRETAPRSSQHGTVCRPADPPDASARSGAAPLPPTRPPVADGQRLPPDRFLARLVQDLQSVDRGYFVTLYYLDKLVSYRQSYQEDERATLLWLEKVIENIAPQHRLVLVGLQDTLLPIELYTHSPKTSVLGIPLPDQQDRRAYLDFRAGRHLHDRLGDAPAEQFLELASQLTDGLYLRDLDNIASELLDDRRTPIQSDRDVKRLVDKYRLGEQEDHWLRLDIPKLNDARKWFVQVRGVKGQEEAVQRVIDVLCMARAGLAGTASGTLAKPKGALFFAGPTGVGKTFLAKKLAEFLFGTEEAFLRFDMSEFKEEHTVSKLIGAPPSYVGHELGGRLTNSVRQRPFSVVLFDEIEKAHPKIMDIFLQILDDGRLTDSRGQTVFFTETIIIFTSNLGTRTHDSRNQPMSERADLERILDAHDADPAQRRQSIREHFTRAVQSFFLHEISRPELLNRIGSNILPFNYIQDTEVQRAIIQSHLERIRRHFADQHRADGHRIEWDASVADWLIGKYGQRMSQFGARGITDAIDEMLVPLAYAVLEAEYGALQNVVFRVGISPQTDTAVVTCKE